MADSPYLHCTSQIAKLTLEELTSLQALVLMAMQAKSYTGLTALPAIDLEDLVKKAMQLLNSPLDLTGWETALLVGVVVQCGGFYDASSTDDAIDSRSITMELRRYAPRSIANITSVIDTLRERNFLEEAAAASREKGAHRTFRINLRGQQEALKIWGRCEKSLAA